MAAKRSRGSAKRATKRTAKGSTKRSTKRAAKTTGARTAAERAAPLPPQRSCGTMQNHYMLLEMYPSFRDRLFKLESQTAAFRNAPLAKSAQQLATIKVVVHVVFNDPSQNISDAQIKSQIAVLNRDFRAKNTDKSKTPAPFKGLVTDSMIHFTLDHITRTPTAQTSFSDQNNGVKKTALGGVPPDDTTKFLNIWVCALGGS